MSEHMSNQLILIEKGSLFHYDLDQKTSWIIGRASRSSKAEIKVTSETVSRDHGIFTKDEGYWFYSDHSKNGTVYNGTVLTKGLGGRVKSVMLDHGDLMILGSGSKAKITDKSVCVCYGVLPDNIDWKFGKTEAGETVWITDGKEKKELNHSDNPVVVEFDEGMAILLGDQIYWSTNLKLVL